jgi:hypothetical protein
MNLDIQDKTINLNLEGSNLVITRGEIINLNAKELGWKEFVLDKDTGSDIPNEDTAEQFLSDYIRDEYTRKAVELKLRNICNETCLQTP